MIYSALDGDSRFHVISRPMLRVKTGAAAKFPALLPLLLSVRRIRTWLLRTPEQLRITPGVYGDDLKAAQHFTSDELRRQAAAVIILNRAQSAGRYVSNVSAEAEFSEMHLPILYHGATLRGADF